MPLVVLFPLVRQARSRSDHTHLAAQDIKELRQLVKTRFSQEFSDPRDAWIVGDFFDFFFFLRTILLDKFADELAMNRVVAVRVHRSEFIKLERLSVFADALRAEKYGTFRRIFNQRGDD